MTDVAYKRQLTALLVIDPYNDFISEGGKVWPRLKAVAEANLCVPHMVEVLTAARKAGLRVFYPLHHRYRPGDYESWKYVAPIQRAPSQHTPLDDRTGGREGRTDELPLAGQLFGEVTVVKDATASYSDEHMRAALEIALPNYASAIVTAREVAEAIAQSTD